MEEYANILKKFLDSKSIEVSTPSNWWYLLSTKALPTIDNVIRLPEDIWFEISDSWSFKFKSSSPDILKKIQVPWQLLYNDMKVSKKLQWDVDSFYENEIEDWLERSYQEQQLINRWMAWVLANDDLWYFRLLRWTKSKAQSDNTNISPDDNLSKERNGKQKFPFIRVFDKALSLYEVWLKWVNNQQTVLTSLVNYINNRWMNVKFWADTKFNALTQEDMMLSMFATSEQEYEINVAYILEKAWIIDAQQAANILSNVWAYSKLRSKKNIVRQLTRSRNFGDLNKQRKTPNWTQLGRIVDLYINHRDEIQSGIRSSEFDETWLAKNIVSFLVNLDGYYNQNLWTRKEDTNVSVDQVKEILTKSEEWDWGEASIEIESKYTMIRDFLDILEENLSVVQVNELNPTFKLEPDMFVNKPILKIVSWDMRKIKVQEPTIDIEWMFGTGNLKEVYKKITWKTKSKVLLSDITYEINRLNKMKLSKRKKLSKDKISSIATVIWNKNVRQWLWWLKELRVAKWIDKYDKWNPENINAENFEKIKLDSIPKMKKIYTIITWLETIENSFDKLKELLQPLVFYTKKDTDAITDATAFVNWNDVKVQESITTLDNRVFPVERSYNTLDLVDYVQWLVLDYNKYAWMPWSVLSLNYANMDKIKDDWFGPADRMDAVRSIVKDILGTYAESFDSLNLISKTIDWIKLDYISKQKLIKEILDIILEWKVLNRINIYKRLRSLWLNNEWSTESSWTIVNTQVNKTRALMLSPVVEEFKKLADAFDISYQEKWIQDLDIYASKLKNLWSVKEYESSEMFDVAPESIARSWEDNTNFENLDQFPALKDALDKWRINLEWNRNSYYWYPWYVMARDWNDMSSYVEIITTDFETLEKKVSKVPQYKLYKFNEFKKIKRNWKVELLDYDDYTYLESKKKIKTNIESIVKQISKVESIPSNIPYFEKKIMYEWLITWKKFVRSAWVNETKARDKRIIIDSMERSWMFDNWTIELAKKLELETNEWKSFDERQKTNHLLVHAIQQAKNTNNPCKI